MIKIVLFTDEWTLNRSQTDLSRIVLPGLLKVQIISDQSVCYWNDIMNINYRMTCKWPTLKIGRYNLWFKEYITTSSAKFRYIPSTFSEPVLFLYKTVECYIWYSQDIQDTQEDMCGNVMLVIAFLGLFSVNRVCTLGKYFF